MEFIGGCDGAVVRVPEDIRPFLAKPYHWKKGRSAYELAHSWLSANGFPAPVKSVLDTCEAHRDHVPELGHFEKCVKLPGDGYDSQTDLMVYSRLGDLFPAVVIAVEGKVDEKFGDLVRDWYDRSDGKKTRLEALAHDLGLAVEETFALRYQLVHRTASALYEARKNHCAEALMLVHCFDPKHARFSDFEAFSQAMRVCCARNGVSDPVPDLDINLRLGWVCDLPC